MKSCTKCQKQLPITQFYRKGNRHTSLCRDCWSAHYRKWKTENKASVMIARKVYYEKNKEDSLRYSRKRYAENPLRSKDMRLRRIFGITLSQYEDMFRLQNGGCAICHKQNLNGRRLAVDHNHATGTVRGLLCHKCNVGLGHFFDNAEAIRAAADYLEARSYIESRSRA